MKKPTPEERRRRDLSNAALETTINNLLANADPAVRPAMQKEIMHRFNRALIRSVKPATKENGRVSHNGILSLRDEPAERSKMVYPNIGTNHLPKHLFRIQIQNAERDFARGGRRIMEVEKRLRSLERNRERMDRAEIAEIIRNAATY